MEHKKAKELTGGNVCNVYYRQSAKSPYKERSCNKC